MKNCEKCKAEMGDEETICTICNLSEAVKARDKKEEVKKKKSK